MHAQGGLDTDFAAQGVAGLGPVHPIELDIGGGGKPLFTAYNVLEDFTGLYRLRPAA